MAKISSRSRFKLAQIKKDFLAGIKKNRHSLQRVNFVSDNTYAITTAKYNTSYDGKQMKRIRKIQNHRGSKHYKTNTKKERLCIDQGS